MEQRSSATYREAQHRSALVRDASRVWLFSCWMSDGLWKATQAGNVLWTTRSHSWINSWPILGIMLATVEQKTQTQCAARGRVGGGTSPG